MKHEHLTMMSTFLLSIETAKAIVAFLKAEYAKANEPKIETEKEGE